MARLSKLKERKNRFEKKIEASAEKKKFKFREIHYLLVINVIILIAVLVK